MADDEPRPIADMTTEQVEKELEELGVKNNELGMDLKKQGAELDLNSMTRTRLELLVIHLLGEEGDDERMRFELRWHRVLNEQIRGIQKQVNRAKLMAGGHMPKGSQGPSPGSGGQGGRGGIIRGRG